MGIWRGTPAHGAIFSDGIHMLCLNMPGGAPHAPFFSPLFSFESEIRSGNDGGRLKPPEDADLSQAQAQLGSFLLSPRVTANTTNDITLLLFSLAGGSPAGQDQVDREWGDGA